MFSPIPRRLLFLLVLALSFLSVAAGDAPGGGDTGIVILPNAAAPAEDPRDSVVLQNVSALELVPQSDLAGATANLMVDGIWYGAVAVASPNIVLDAEFVSDARTAGVDEFDLVIVSPDQTKYLLVRVYLLEDDAVQVDSY